MNLEPLLAYTIETDEDFDKVTYPVYVSPKVDAIRCLVGPKAVPHSRKGTPFMNKDLVAEFVKHPQLQGLDGELGVGNPLTAEFFGKSSGWCRRKEGMPEEGFTFYVFDRIGDQSFHDRFINNLPNPFNTPMLKVVIVPQILCKTPEEVRALAIKWIKDGWEGVMLRFAAKEAGGYKHGRSTPKDQQLGKYKIFVDTEGVIIGFEEGETNNNPKGVDAFGNSKRSQAKAGKVPNGMAGKILVDCPDFPNTVKLGTGIGLTHELRFDMWQNPAKYIGRTVTFSHQLGTDYEEPRIASFKGFRDDGI